jgi:hypothetical protein
MCKQTVDSGEYSRRFQSWEDAMRINVEVNEQLMTKAMGLTGT